MIADVCFKAEDVNEILVCRNEDRPYLFVRICGYKRLVRMVYDNETLKAVNSDESIRTRYFSANSYNGKFRQSEKFLAETRGIKVFKHYKNATPQQFKDEYNNFYEEFSKI